MSGGMCSLPGLWFPFHTPGARDLYVFGGAAMALRFPVSERRSTGSVADWHNCNHDQN